MTLTRKQKRIAREAGRNTRYRYLREDEVPPATHEDTRHIRQDPFEYEGVIYGAELLYRRVTRFEGVADKMIGVSYVSEEAEKDTLADLNRIREEMFEREAIYQFMFNPPNRRKWPARPYGLRKNYTI